MENLYQTLVSYIQYNSNMAHDDQDWSSVQLSGVFLPIRFPELACWRTLDCFGSENGEFLHPKWDGSLVDIAGRVAGILTLWITVYIYIYVLIITDFYGSGIRKISNSKFHWGSSENRQHWGRPSWSNPFGFQDCGMLLWIKYMAADDMDTAMGTWNSKLRLSQKKNAKHVHEITEKLGENPP